MRPNHSRALSIAVSSGKIGFVFFSGHELRDWGLSSVASRSPEAAEAKVRQWIKTYCPHLIVTEKLSSHTRKSGRTIANVQAVEAAAIASDAQHIAVEHIQRYANKYLEMNELVQKHPVLAPWLPTKRKLWESEDRRASIWEALALVEQAEL